MNPELLLDITELVGKYTNGTFGNERAMRVRDAIRAIEEIPKNADPPMQAYVDVGQKFHLAYPPGTRVNWKYVKRVLKRMKRVTPKGKIRGVYIRLLTAKENGRSMELCVARKSSGPFLCGRCPTSPSPV